MLEQKILDEEIKLFRVDNLYRSIRMKIGITN